MGNSLFDQLKKTGLIDEKKANKSKKEKHKLAKQQKGKLPRPLSETKQRVQQAQAEKSARDRKLNQQHKEASTQNAIAAQVKQLINMNRIENSAGDIRFNFIDNNKVQRLYVTRQLQDQLAQGHVTIVKLDGIYDLVPSEIAAKISIRDPACAILTHSNRSVDSSADDPYDEYQVPDDLMW